MKIKKSKEFKNGKVYCFELDDGFLIETTDTFLPLYTKYLKNNTNCLYDFNIGSRKDRWMIGVSVMSGCPVRCKFCATGNLKKYKKLTSKEIIDQVEYIIQKSNYNFLHAKEHKINYTRMGEPFLNIENVKKAIYDINKLYPNTHHYVSTIGIKNSDFSWIKDNITLQISLHSLNESRRNHLIPYKNKMTIKELGQIRTKSNLKTTLNLTLVDNDDFDINILKKYFDANYFFIKLSPINRNEFSDKNLLGKGIIQTVNLI